jgi:hypothetical protein
MNDPVVVLIGNYRVVVTSDACRLFKVLGTVVRPIDTFSKAELGSDAALLLAVRSAMERHRIEAYESGELRDAPGPTEHKRDAS